MQASRNCRRPPVRRRYWRASPRKNCPNIWASSFTLDYTDETESCGASCRVCTMYVSGY
jgi:hypothetical protein